MYYAEITLKESNLSYEIDLQNKPEWYATSQPSEQGNFVDIDENLLPKDPVTRARARFSVLYSKGLLTPNLFLKPEHLKTNLN